MYDAAWKFNEMPPWYHINHAAMDKANLLLEAQEEDGETTGVQWRAIQDIEINDELCFDYTKDNKDWEELAFLPPPKET